MIKLTRYDNKELFINAELIKFIESKPDTIITLTSGEILVVKEPADAVAELVIEYKKNIHQPIKERA